MRQVASMYLIDHVRSPDCSLMMGACDKQPHSHVRLVFVVRLVRIEFAPLHDSVTRFKGKIRRFEHHV